MSKKVSVPSGSGLHEVRVEMKEKPRRHTHGQICTIKKGITPKVSSISSDFVYVNSAYAGSLNSINDRRIGEPVLEPPTSVIREQYWTCSKWPFGQRVLAIAVGVLLGAVVGLAITMALRGDDKDGDGIGLFRSHPAPD